MSLNIQYFEKVHVETKNDIKYESYRPRDKPMVLFSLKDGSPLASLTLRCQTTSTQVDSKGTRGKALITARPDNSTEELQKFQGLIDRDGQEFEFVITNLSSSGYINFNILKSDEKVTSVNPEGLNEINELRPNESYAVKCSQENNLSLILSSIVDKETGSSITIKQDEDHSKQTGEKTKGTYYFLSIVPQASNKELCDRFDKTIWRCVDLLARETKVINPYITDNAIGAANWNNMLGIPNNNFNNVHHDGMNYAPILENSMIGGKRGVIGGFTRGFTREGIRATQEVNKVSKGAKMSKHKSNIRVDGYESTHITDTTGITNTTDAINTTNISSKHAPSTELYEPSISVDELESSHKMKKGDESSEECEEYIEDCLEFDGFDEDDEWDEVSDEEASLSVNIKSKSKPSNKNTSISQQDDVIMNSNAASISYGRHVEVNSAETGIVYDYDKSCARCVIGLSVSDKLEFYPEPDIQELIEDSKLLFKEYQENKYIEVLSRVYDMGDCCICLEEDPNTIFYQCGHKCIHILCIDKDINKCPVCRTRISAYLKLNSPTEPVGILNAEQMEQLEQETHSSEISVCSCEEGSN